MGEYTKVEIIKDSMSKAGKRLTTMRLTYPRIIHDEFLTHRAFSRNSSSNRAIPTKKLLEDIKYTYFKPERWEKNKKGMSSEEVCDPLASYRALTLWNKHHQNTLEVCAELEELGIHKQFINYLLLPFQYIKTLVTATEWDNFFELRLPKNAHPEIRDLAEKMKGALEASVPEGFEYFMHLPFCNEPPMRSMETMVEYMISSIARAARVSYNKTEEQPGLEADTNLVAMLWENRHMSPFEHVAVPSNSRSSYMNLKGWISVRYFMETDWYNPFVRKLEEHLMSRRLTWAAK